MPSFRCSVGRLFCYVAAATEARKRQRPSFVLLFARTASTLFAGITLSGDVNMLPRIALRDATRRDKQAADSGVKNMLLPRQHQPNQPRRSSSVACATATPSRRSRYNREYDTA